MDHKWHSLNVADVQITTYSYCSVVSAHHLPTGLIAFEFRNRSLTANKNEALHKLSDLVQEYYFNQQKGTPAMPTVEKAYDKIILSADDVQKALKQYVRLTTKREVRGDVKVNTNGNGFQTTAYAVLEDQPREAYDTPKAL